MSPKSSASQLILQVEIFGEQVDLESYFLKLEKDGKEEYLRILEGDRVDSLEDTHKVVYLVQVPYTPKRAAGVRQVRPELLGDVGEVRDLLRLLSMEEEQVVELCWITLAE